MPVLIRMTKRKVTLVALFGALALAAACAPASTSYSGTLQSESANVGSDVGGRIVAVLVSDGDIVRKGQIIVRFDAKDQNAALAQARGALAQANATLDDLEAGARPQDVEKADAQAAQAQYAYDQAMETAPHEIDQAAQAVRQTRAALVEAERDWRRSQVLLSEGAISAQQADASTSAFRQARAAYRSAQAHLNAQSNGAVPRGIDAARAAYQAAAANAALVAAGSRPDQIAQARAAVQTAQAGVAAARARLDEAAVVAPVDGQIDGLDLRAGDLVPAGAAVATVDEFVDPYVRIYVPQTQFGDLAVGRRVDVVSDALPNRTFDGRIEALDRTAQFTPRDVQSADDRASLAFGLKVRVHDPDRLLRGGTTVEVRL